MNRYRRAGIALLTTMMVMALLLTLIGAFISVEKSSSRLTGNALQRRSAQDACLTALNIAWNYLENDPEWGSSGHFPTLGARSYPASNPIVSLEQNQIGSDKVLIGVIHASGAFDAPDASHFEMRIYNNLRSRTPALSQIAPVPARSVRLICKSWTGNTARRMDTILRQVPMSNDSLVGKSAVNLGPTTGLLRLESRDPYVNRIRSGGDMDLPTAPNVQFLKSGSADAGAELRLNTVPQDANAARDAGPISGGIYNIGQGPVKIPTFSSDNFKLPDASKTSEAKAGTYTFGGLPRVEYKEHQIDWKETTTTTDPVTGQSTTTTETGECDRYQKISSVYDQLVDAEGRIWVSKDARAGTTTMDPPGPPPSGTVSEATASSWGYSSGGPPNFGSDPNNPVNPAGLGSDVHEIYPGLFANVKTAQMAIRSGVKVHSTGSFLVVADGSRQPEMMFGYQFSPGGVAVQESLNDGLDAALNDPAKYMAALEAAGSVDIPGGVLGYGSLVAGGDMTLKASAGLRAAPQLGVVVKARNLTINPATEPEPQLPGEPVITDYPVFQQAITAFAGGDWTQFDTWSSQTAPQRLATTRSMKTTPLAETATYYWNRLNTELHTSFPVPTFGSGWSGAVTVEQYIRLKEYIQTLASGYNHGAGDPSWIDMSQHATDAEARISNTVSTMAQWAKSYKKSLQAYLANPAPEVPDMFYQGLLYADQNLIVNGNGKSFRLEGSAVAGGNASIVGARSVDLVYDRALVDDQMKTNKSLDGNTSHLRLEKIFFTIQ